MKLILIGLIFVISIFFTSCNVTFEAGGDQTKFSKVSCDGHKAAIIEAIGDLSKLSHSGVNDQNESRHEKMREIVERFDNAKDIATLARMSRALVVHNGYAECIQGSELYTVYDETFWHAVKTLSKRKDEESKRELARLREGDSLFGTEKNFFDKITEEDE